MCKPTAQDYFGGTRFDDPGLLDPHRVFRHCRTPVQIVPCKLNGQKLSDRVFKSKTGDAGVSVEVGCLLANDAVEPSARLGKLPNTVLIGAILIKDARECSAGVAWTPKPETTGGEGFANEPNPYHGEIINPMTNAQVRELSSRIAIVAGKLAE